MAFKRKAFPKENITKEFEPIGDRRIRIIDNRTIDIREYVEAESFTGFTRKGIRVNRDEAKAIVAAMQEFIAGEGATEVWVAPGQYEIRQAQAAPAPEPMPEDTGGWVFEAGPGVEIHRIAA